MSFEEMLKATLTPVVREAVRAELRAAAAETKPVSEAEYLSVAEASRIADVDPKTLRRWMKEGKLPRHHAGREHRVRRDELVRYLEGPQEADGTLTHEAAAANVLRKLKGG